MRRMLLHIAYLLLKQPTFVMSRKWINPVIGLLAGVLTYMLVSGDSLGIVGFLTFAGTFAIVWVGLDFITVKTEQPGEGLSPDDAT